MFWLFIGMMQDLTTKTHVEQFPIIDSGFVAKVSNGTGQSEANTVVTTLEEWGLAEKVVGLSFDTNCLKYWTEKWGMYYH